MTRTRPRSARAAVTAAAASAVLLLAACGQGGPAATGSGSGDAGRFAVDVDVDTPALRRARDEAGLAECPALPAGRDAAAATATAAASPLPEVTLPCLGGGPDVFLPALRGPMVVNLWAQWCGPCRAELPHYQELSERAGDRLQVLGIDYQDTRPDWALDLLEETGVTYPSLADPAGQLRVPLRVRGLPAILFVDEQGRVVHQEFSVVESYQQLAGLVRAHLGVAVGGAG